MSRFGGQSKFGIAKFGGDPYLFDPGYVTDRIVAALKARYLTDNGGWVRVIDRLPSRIDDQAAIDLMLKTGTPAFLVVYLGGEYSRTGTRGSEFSQVCRWSIIAISANQTSRRARVQGRTIYRPSTDSMIRWALVEAIREMQTIKMIKLPAPVSERPIMFGPSRFAAALELEAIASVDVYDDDATLTTKLERIGICHTPDDLNELFEGDNLTPNSSDATNNTPNVAELDE